jgi:hypothetical protein
MNCMDANPDKFQCMFLNAKPTFTRFNIYVDNTPVKVTECIKILGVYVDQALKFSSHVEHMCKRANQQLHALRRLRNVLDQSSRHSIYTSFIMSVFNYCSIVWMFTNKVHLARLCKIQERALRFVYHDSSSGYESLLKACNTPPINVFLLRSLLIEVFKCVNNINPTFLNELFIEGRCYYETRNKNSLYRPKVRTTLYGLKSFTSYGAKLWNNLPTVLRESTALSQFKRNLMSWYGPSCTCKSCLHFMTVVL